MKKNSKLIIGIFLIAGVILLGYMDSTYMVSGDPPQEKDPDDPGNATGPGISESKHIDAINSVNSVEVVSNSLR